MNNVAKVSSYTIIFETNIISAGSMFIGTPSLGKSGYMKLNGIKKFTRMEYLQTRKGGYYNTDMPIESSQTLEIMRFRPE